MVKKRSLANNTIHRRGRLLTDEWQSRVEHTLKNLGDRSVLNRSPLAKLVYIEKLATRQYHDHILPRGLALHDVLLACVTNISAELKNEPALERACSYLELLASGQSCRSISSRLGVSR